MHCGDPSASAHDVAVPEVDMGNPSTPALYRTLHQVVTELYKGVLPATSVQNTTVPGACCGDTPSSAEAYEVGPEADMRSSLL